MNESPERRAEEQGVVASQTEVEVVKDAPEEAVTAASPFGSAATAAEEEGARELPPILDLPESETRAVEVAEEPARELPPILDLPESETQAVEVAEEVTLELPPILDLPVQEAAPAETTSEHEASVLEEAPAPVQEYELPRVDEPVAAEPAPVETSQTTGSEQSIYDDPMFGPLKRLLVDLVGEG